jgi:hypothetical protein
VLVEKDIRMAPIITAMNETAPKIERILEN